MTAIAVFDRGPAVPRQAVSAGQIGMLWGLAEAQIGDRIGDRIGAPPATLEGCGTALPAADAGVRRRAL